VLKVLLDDDDDVLIIDYKRGNFLAYKKGKKYKNRITGMVK